MKQDKKIKERSILDLFREKFPEFPKGKIMASESPDFLLKLSPKRSIGIELTTLPSSSYLFKNKMDYQVFISDIQIIINKKIEKHRLYRKKLANEYWLIIYVDSIETGNFNLNNHLERIGEDKLFDRVFLFDLFDGDVVEVG